MPRASDRSKLRRVRTCGHAPSFGVVCTCLQPVRRDVGEPTTCGWYVQGGCARPFKPKLKLGTGEPGFIETTVVPTPADGGKE